MKNINNFQDRSNPVLLLFGSVYDTLRIYISGLSKSISLLMPSHESKTPIYEKI